METRFIQMEKKLSGRTLEKNLVFTDFEKYRLANTNVDQTFTNLNIMCNKEIVSNRSEEGP